METIFWIVWGPNSARNRRRRLPTSLAVAFIPFLVEMILEILDQDLDVAAVDLLDSSRDFGFV